MASLEEISEMTKAIVFIILSVCNVSVMVMDILELQSDVTHMEKTQEERRRQCLVDCNYTGLNIYTNYGCCNETYYIKSECLMCGLPVEITRHRHLCPFGDDNPERFLTCEKCQSEDANPCKNNATAMCPRQESLGSELKCQCRPGYTGRFCEQKILLCGCQNEVIDRRLAEEMECWSTNTAPCYVQISQKVYFICRDEYRDLSPLENRYFCDSLPKWHYGNWSQCSKTCGEGLKRREVQCLRESENGTMDVLNDSSCQHFKMLRTVAKCQIERCPVIRNFKMNFYQRTNMDKIPLLAGMNAYVFANTFITIECRTKGIFKSEVEWLKNGIILTNGKNEYISNIKISKRRKLILHQFNNKNATYTCRVGNFSVNSSIYIVSNFIRNVPYSLMSTTTVKNPIDRRYYPVFWTLSSWSPCNRLCGIGNQTRTARSEIVTERYIVVLYDLKCKDINGCKESLTRPCNTQQCLRWKYDQWTKCTKSCGGGIRIRSSLCTKLLQNGTSIQFTNHECNNLKKSEDVKRCNIFSCSVREIVNTNVTFFQLKHVPKVFLNIGMNGSVLLHSRVVIDCQTRGIARKSIQWLRNGVPVRRSRNLRISKRYKIRIPSASYNDEAAYCCQYKMLQVCTNLKVHTMQKAKEVFHIRRKNSLFNHSMSLFTKDPFDKKKRSLSISLSDWSTCSTTCGEGIQTRQVFCEIISKSYIEVFNNRYCFNETFSANNLELRQRCTSVPC